MARPRLRRAPYVTACLLATACAVSKGPSPAAPAPKVFSAPARPAPPGGAPPEAWIAACEPGTPAHREAERTLSRLDALVNGLRPEGDPNGVLSAMSEALAGECFRISAGDEPTLEPDSGYALKYWWNEAGGRWWASHYLNLKKPRDQTGEPSSVVAPTVRKTLTRETRPRHPLFELLCGVGEPKCGAETEGWRERAEYAYGKFAEAKRAAWLDSGREQPPPESVSTCLAKASSGPEGERYGAWRACLRSATRTRTRLPLGAIKAPRRGWLIVRGRRGHYSFCDEARAYDLATGAAYVARSCGGLALRPDGSVDGRRTDEGREGDTAAGRVSVEALREAALMTLLAPEAQHDVADAWGYALPEGVEPKAPEGGATVGLGLSFSTSSAQTTLAVRYVVDTRVIAEGTLTWPEDYNDAAREHAVRLLRYAESTLRPGCPSVAPPVFALGAAGPGVSALDASPRSLPEVERSLVASFAGARRAACAMKQ